MPLANLPLRSIGQELQQFVCALNWMRTSIHAFNKLVNPLLKFMEKVYEQAGVRKKNQVRRVLLRDGATIHEAVCLEQCNEALKGTLQLSHLNPEKRLSVFTDASNEHEEPAITQISPETADRELIRSQATANVEWNFLGFNKAEKEVYVIIETWRRADYFLHRSDRFVHFTDYQNLRYIFDPHSVSRSVPRYSADKLHRWSMLLMAYKLILRKHRIPKRSDPVILCSLSLVHCGEKQTAECGFPIAQLSSKCGSAYVAGHHGVATTQNKVASLSVRTDIEKYIEVFVRRCLHCASTVGGPPQLRVWGEAMHTESPNELIHWDYLFMRDSISGEVYILVIKDDSSKFMWLFSCEGEAADAETTFDCLMKRFATFGVCHTRASNHGTHFKNTTIEALQHALGAHYHFSTARCE
ncbi:LOW QUALITY PROTEIN: hypothetical protein PHMEG_00013706 [Phytophthora megakarya]|uniref:Integrase catalytic domain-containing protein n=1 Tax=Phytophthora megakarya TaxID=4795 RepID=A0A225W872_9STRA|nr:LOW QUALITY PROTEIN: hypothetical protein PHMEG_00013706 [Phytophthora megakarya]